MSVASLLSSNRVVSVTSIWNNESGPNPKSIWPILMNVSPVAGSIEPIALFTTPAECSATIGIHAHGAQVQVDRPLRLEPAQLADDRQCR